jgi:hypothetical protein
MFRIEIYAGAKLTESEADLSCTALWLTTQSLIPPSASAVARFALLVYAPVRSSLAIRSQNFSKHSFLSLRVDTQPIMPSEAQLIEEKVLKACDEYRRRECATITDAANAFDAPRQRVSRRLRGGIPSVGQADRSRLNWLVGSN